MEKKSSSSRKTLKNLFSRSEVNLSEPEPKTDSSRGSLRLFKWKKKKKNESSEDNPNTDRAESADGEIQDGEEQNKHKTALFGRSKKGMRSYSETDLRKPKGFIASLTWKKKKKKNRDQLQDLTSNSDISGVKNHISEQEEFDNREETEQTQVCFEAVRSTPESPSASDQSQSHHVLSNQSTLSEVDAGFMPTDQESKAIPYIDSSDSDAYHTPPDSPNISSDAKSQPDTQYGKLSAQNSITSETSEYYICPVTDMKTAARTETSTVRSSQDNVVSQKKSHLEHGEYSNATSVTQESCIPRPERSNSLSIPKSSVFSIPENSFSSDPQISTSSIPQSSSTSDPQISSSSIPESSSTSDPQISSSSIPESSSTSDPQISSSSIPQSSTSVPQISTSLIPESSFSSDPQISTSLIPESSFSSDPQISTSLIPESSSTSDPQNSSSSIPQSSTSVPQISTSLIPESSFSSDPQISTSLIPESSFSSDPQISTSSIPQSFSTSVPQISSSSIPQSSTSVPQISTSLIPESSFSSDPQISTSLIPESSSTSDPQNSSSSIPQSSTSVPQISTSLIPESSFSSDAQISTSLIPESSSTSDPQISTSSIPQSFSTSVPQISTSSIPQSFSTSVPQISTSSIPQGSSSSDPKISTSSAPENFSSFVPQIPTSSVPQCSSTSVPQISLSSIPQVSSTSVYQMSTSSIPQSYTSSVPQRSTPSVHESVSSYIPQSSTSTIQDGFNSDSTMTKSSSTNTNSAFNLPKGSISHPAHIISTEAEDSQTTSASIRNESFSDSDVVNTDPCSATADICKSEIVSSMPYVIVSSTLSSSRITEKKMETDRKPSYSNTNVSESDFTVQSTSDSGSLDETYPESNCGTISKESHATANYSSLACATDSEKRNPAQPVLPENELNIPLSSARTYTIIKSTKIVTFDLPGPSDHISFDHSPRSLYNNEPDSDVETLIEILDHEGQDNNQTDTDSSAKASSGFPNHTNSSMSLTSYPPLHLDVSDQMFSSLSPKAKTMKQQKTSRACEDQEEYLQDASTQRLESIDRIYQNPSNTEIMEATKLHKALEKVAMVEKKNDELHVETGQLKTSRPYEDCEGYAQEASTQSLDSIDQINLNKSNAEIKEATKLHKALEKVAVIEKKRDELYTETEKQQKTFEAYDDREVYAQDASTQRFIERSVDQNTSNAEITESTKLLKALEKVAMVEKKRDELYTETEKQQKTFEAYDDREVYAQDASTQGLGSIDQINQNKSNAERTTTRNDATSIQDTESKQILEAIKLHKVSEDSPMVEKKRDESHMDQISSAVKAEACGGAGVLTGQAEPQIPSLSTPKPAIPVHQEHVPEECTPAPPFSELLKVSLTDSSMQPESHLENLPLPLALHQSRTEITILEDTAGCKHHSSTDKNTHSGYIDTLSRTLGSESQDCSIEELSSAYSTKQTFTHSNDSKQEEVKADGDKITHLSWNQISESTSDDTKIKKDTDVLADQTASDCLTPAERIVHATVLSTVIEHNQVLNTDMNSGVSVLNTKLNPPSSPRDGRDDGVVFRKVSLVKNELPEPSRASPELQRRFQALQDKTERSDYTHSYENAVYTSHFHSPETEVTHYSGGRGREELSLPGEQLQIIQTHAQCDPEPALFIVEADDSDVFQAMRVELHHSPTSTEPPLLSSEMDNLVDTLKSMDRPLRQRVQRTPSNAPFSSLPPIEEDAPVSPSITHLSPPFSPVNEPKTMLNGSSGLDFGFNWSSAKDMRSPLTMMKEQQFGDAQNRGLSLPLRASALSSIVMRRSSLNDLSPEDGSAKTLINGASSSSRLENSFFFQPSENGASNRSIFRAASLPDIGSGADRISSAAKSSESLVGSRFERFSYLTSPSNSLSGIAEASRISVAPFAQTQSAESQSFSHKSTSELYRSLPSETLLKSPPSLSLQRSSSLDGGFLINDNLQVNQKLEPEPERNLLLKYRAFPDAYLTKEKEHGKLNPRPGKIIIYNKPGFSGERIEVRGDVVDATPWEFTDTISIRVIRGGWVFYEKPDFKGEKIALDEGEMELTDPFRPAEEEEEADLQNGGESYGEMVNDGEEQQKNKPHRKRKFSIGSIRRAVRDYSVPEISLFPEEMQKERR
ncbi:serine-rich adhesin for platelets [Danio aesculapii]|uniref:serine-rich adhesin for platelets n=1 Tax=Danio aesculapii TaxID=1142201 RepID=UPI0024BFCFD5|nr:serine-rich adhesin for platelets [Danio aesculapii]